MKTKNLVLSALLLGGVALYGCGDEDDPAGATDTSTTEDVARDDTGTTETDTGVTDTDTGVETDTDLPDTDDTDTTETDTTETDTTVDPDTGSDTCAEPFYTGQAYIAADRTDEPNGGVAVFSMADAGYTDGGLAALLAAAPASSTDGPAVVDGEWALTGVTVSATMFNSSSWDGANNEFWIADEAGFMKIALDTADGEARSPMAATFPIRVGQQVSFTVTQITNSYGVPQITGIQADSWSLDADDSFVYLEEIGTESLTEDYINHVIRLTGTLGEGTSCGGSSLCYDLDYGAAETVVFRSASSYLAAGDCITFVGPVGWYNNMAQLNSGNFDWTWNNSGT